MALINQETIPPKKEHVTVRLDPEVLRRLDLYCRFIQSGIDAGANLLSGKSAAHGAIINTSKSYNVVRNVVLEPKVFAERKNAQSIVLAYDGLNPLPPTYCYLKPYYLDPNRTWFEQLADGEI